MHIVTLFLSWNHTDRARGLQRSQGSVALRHCPLESVDSPLDPLHSIDIGTSSLTSAAQSCPVRILLHKTARVFLEGSKVQAASPLCSWFPQCSE